MTVVLDVFEPVSSSSFSIDDVGEGLVKKSFGDLTAVHVDLVKEVLQ